MKSLILAVLLSGLTTVSMAQSLNPPPGRMSQTANTTAKTAPPSAQKATLWQFFCPQGKCLYYAGDWSNSDCHNPNLNALFDFDNPGISTSGEVWVGVKPTKDAVITGSAGNYLTTTFNVGINPTPFMVRTGISTGNAGKLVCSTHGNVTSQGYGGTCGLGVASVNYYIAKLAKACRVKAGRIYYVDLTPQYDDGTTIGYLKDVVDKKGPYHIAWPNLWDDSYLTYSDPENNVSYEPTWGSSGACLGAGCDAFSMALTGRE